MDEPEPGAAPPRLSGLRRRGAASTDLDDDLTSQMAGEPGAVPGFEPARSRRAARSRWRRAIDSPTTVLVNISIALGLLAGGFTAYYQYTRPETYRSTAVLLIDQVRAIASSTDDGVLNKLARARVKYSGIVTTQLFQQPLAQQDGLPLGVVGGALSTTVDPTSLLLRIAATTGNRAESQRLAQDAAQHLVDYTAQEQQQAGIKPDQQIQFIVVSRAGLAVRVTPDRQRAMLVGGFVFVALTIVGMLGADLLRRRQRRRR